MARRRRALIFLGESDILNLLRIPEGVSLVGIRDNFYCNGLELCVEGEQFEEVPEGCEAPRVRSQLEYDEVLDVFRINLEM